MQTFSSGPEQDDQLAQRMAALGVSEADIEETIKQLQGGVKQTMGPDLDRIIGELARAADVDWPPVIERELADQMIIAMALDRARKGVIYITGRDGVHRSEDGGVTWTSINSGFATTNIRTIAQSLSDPKLFYAGTNGSGLYRSRDAGETWEAMPPVVPTHQG